MSDSSKLSAKEYAKKVSDMATGQFRRVPIEFVPALPPTKDPIYAQRMPNEAESIEVLRAATGRRRDPFPHPAREQSEAASQFTPGQTVFWNGDDEKATVIAQDGATVFLRAEGQFAGRHTLCDADLLTATDPNQPADPQNCPFCGCKASILLGNHVFRVECDLLKCDFAGPGRETKEEAIAAWNSIRIVKEEKVKP